MHFEPIILADHAALDLLNTRPQVNGKLVDFLQSDADVLCWLSRTGFSVTGAISNAFPSALLDSARILRETIRRLIEKRKSGERGNPSALNAFLAEAQTYPRLIWDNTSSPIIKRMRQQGTPEQMLAPVAESAADLLVTGNFDLVKICEEESCVLWFYDQTKSHHRRWCSMATCGNRNKVAAYRKRRLEV